MKRILKVLTLSIATVNCVHADVAGDMNTFFNGIGYASNVTRPAAFQSQAAGFYGGGSLFVRNRVSRYQLVELDLPSYRAGCNGIDLFTGSMSFLSHKKLVDLGKQVMTSSGAYAVDVMLATTVPELKQVRDYLQTLEQKVNQMSVNSCEMAQNFVGGIFPKTAASQQKICKDQAAMGRSGVVSDYVSARMDCAGDAHDGIMAKAEKDPEQKKQVVLNKNIVWSILQNNAFLNGDVQLAEMVMSLTGTLIIDSQGKVKVVPSLAGSSHFIQALLGGNKSASIEQMWRCSDETPGTACMSVSLKEMKIDDSQTLTTRVRNMIEGLDTKLKNDDVPTAEEQNFLSLTMFPVMKFLTVLNSTHYNDAAVEIEGYSTLIAEDLLQHYLSGLLQDVANATAGSELNEDLVKDIQTRIREANREVASIDPKIARKLQEKIALISRMSEIEKQLASGLGNTSH
ncbi:MAG: conjugal transfer protein TraH [Legionellales bacterium]|nr:conjugal transfer protein TraH [Legionellales bacterium]